MITVTQTYAGNFIIPPSINNRRSQGIPPGGPADTFLAAIAHHLTKSDSCLEISTPITLIASESTQIALVAPTHSRPLAEHPLTTLALLALNPGEPLTIQAPQTGFRLYLSWSGLTSPSRFPKQLNSNLDLPSGEFTRDQVRFDPSASPVKQDTLRFLPTDVMASQMPCAVTPHISRIGIRLKPAILQMLTDMKPLHRSEPSILGAIQVTPDRELLIHGPDGPTLGGYPKIGAIIQADLPTLAQLRPNQAINLTPVTLEEARAALQESQKKLTETLAIIDRALAIARSSP